MIVAGLGLWGWSIDPEHPSRWAFMVFFLPAFWGFVEFFQGGRKRERWILNWHRIVVAGVGLVLGGGPAGIGAALGAFVPGYYRSVFPSGGDPNFDPIAVGIGQGLTQGVVFGGIIGLLLVAMFYWNRSRTARTDSD